MFQIRYASFVLTALLFSLICLEEMYGQVTERAEVSEQIQSAPVSSEIEQPNAVEFHYTHILLESEEGQEALKQFHERRDQRLLQPQVQPASYEIGDQEDFKVRNLEESQAGQNVFEDILFELRRMEGNVQVWVEVEELGPDRISEDVLDEIMDGLINQTPANSIEPDKGVVEIGLDLFGELPDAGETGNLKVLITDIQDGWDGEENTFFTAGFFDPVNLNPGQNSNLADIIYINSKPGIYREDSEARNPRLNTMAHELQHLIHANYDNLTLYQNEGQSELAEVLSGFSPRGMSFLNSKSEVSGNVSGQSRWVYRFRSAQSDVVLYDYQRAQLMHIYLEERIGHEAAGSVTRAREAASQNPDIAYSDVLDDHNITLEEFFTDFYISSYANKNVQGNHNFGFSRPQLANIRVFNPGEVYNVFRQPWASNTEEEIYFGGAVYTQWFGVENLVLEINETEGITQSILYRKVGDVLYRFEPAGPGVHRFEEDGIYEEIVLISVNGEASTAGSGRPTDSRTFTYSGDWTPTNLTIEPLVYHQSPAAFFPLPDYEDPPVTSMALRISPTFDSAVQSVSYNMNAREGAVLGNGLLELRLRGTVPSQQNPDILLPGSVIATQSLTANDISVGQNFIGVNSTEWEIFEGEEYFVEIAVIEDQGGLYLEFLVDEGSEDESNTDYYPIRTLLGIYENGEQSGWLSFQNNNNFLMAVNQIGFRDVEDIDFPDRPVAENFKLVKNYPNPFNHSTTIEYNVPQQANVRITIHDVLGRQLMEIFDGEREQGLHRKEFDASALSSGVYFYRLHSPDGIDTRKMMLVK